MKNIIKNISRVCLIMAGTAVLLSGCSEDFLATDPLSFYEPGATFSTESGLRAAMGICDRHLKLYYACDHNEMLPMGTELMFSDLCVAANTDKARMLCNIANDLTPNSDQSTQNYLDRSNSICFFWDEGWIGVRHANTIIKYAPGVEGLDPTIRDAYIGRAYFHRAFRYMALMMQFGEVTVVATLIDTPKQTYYSIKRDALLTMLMKDMEWAVEHVPEQQDMNEIGMVNKGACRVLLTKIYLAIGEYTKAKEQCDILIDQSQYKLVKGEEFGTFNDGGEPLTWPITRNVIWDMHRAENKLISSNTEWIMGMPNRGSDQESFVKMLTMRIFYPFFFNSGLTDPDGKQGLQNYKRNDSKYDAEYDYMRALGRGISTWRNSYWYTHSLWYVNGKEDKGDLRHSSETGNWMRMEDLKYNNRESQYYGQNLRLYSDNGDLLCSDTIRRWYDVPHYKMYLDDPVNDANVSGSDGNRGATTGGNADWYLYRLAEVYLLRAEAKFYINPSDATIADDVNEIRKRAHCDELYKAGSVTIGDIMNERARELYFEEWRNCELTRVSLCLARSGRPDEWGNMYSLETFDKQQGTDEEGGSYWYQRVNHYNIYNKGVVNVTASNNSLNYTIDKKNIYWPIPEKAITANSKGQLHQNFGYDGYDANVKMWETWEEAVADEATN